MNLIRQLRLFDCCLEEDGVLLLVILQVMQTFQKYICQVSSELVTDVQVIAVLYHLQNHHESPAVAGPVPGFGDEG